MDLQKRIDLVTNNTAEVVTPIEIQTLMETNDTPTAYWGFECSGLLHIGIGLVCSAKIKHLVNAGFKFTIFLADWHSWINNKLNGKGVFYYVNGDKYDGDFKDNKLNGYGTLYYKNGNKYEGEWKNNKKNGKGLFLFSNDLKYEGEFKNNLFDGFGTFTYANGKILKGKWKKNKFLE